jgi:hypothetical protein
MNSGLTSVIARNRSSTTWSPSLSPISLISFNFSSVSLFASSCALSFPLPCWCAVSVRSGLPVFLARHSHRSRMPRTQTASVFCTPQSPFVLRSLRPSLALFGLAIVRGTALILRRTRYNYILLLYLVSICGRSLPPATPYLSVQSSVLRAQPREDISSVQQV